MMTEPLSEYVETESADSKRGVKWWDPRAKGTLGRGLLYFTIGLSSATFLIDRGVDRIVDGSKGTVEDVVGDQSKKFKEELGAQMDTLILRAANVECMAQDMREEVETVVDFLEDSGLIEPRPDLPIPLPEPPENKKHSTECPE